jgi:TM2 domain-containing membrane protein YozV
VADSYFVRYRGRTVGPYSLAQAQQMARKGQLSRTSEVSNDGQAWSQAGSFPEIFERPVGGALESRKSSSLSIDTDLQPGGSVTFPACDVPKTPSLNEWYYTSGDEQKGPTSSTNIVAMIKAGTLAAQDRVWREGLNNWVSVSDVPEFSAAISPVLPHQAVAKAGTVEGSVFCRECGNRINRKAVICPNCGVPTDQNESHSGYFQPIQMATTNTMKWPRNAGNPKSRTTAALLAFVLGGLGAHHFYLGNIVVGVIYLLCCMTFIPALIALIEAIVFLCMSNEAFDAKYNT